MTVLLQATSAGIAPDGSTYVVLRWEVSAEAVAYNLYRGTIKINDSPITPTVPPEQLPLVLAAAQADLTSAVAAGIAFIDTTVTAGDQYLYALRGVLGDGTEEPLAEDVPVQAGTFVLPDPPSGVTTQSGDRRALVLWNRNPYAATFVVERASNSGGPFQPVNPNPVAFDLATDLTDQALPTPQPGFLDIGAWTADGLPTSHQVMGVDIYGPDNGTTYWYRVASRDTLDRAGVFSAPVQAMPMRTLPPMAPDALQVSPNTTADGLVITWRTVTRNIENHQLEDDVQTNLVYRADTREALEDLTLPPTHTLTSNPQDLTAPLVSWTDLDPALVPAYGSKPYFYRVRVADPFGHVSSPSAIISAAVPDTRAPGPTALVSTRGAPDHIRVAWSPNTEPDLAGYQIWRGVCDHGYIFVPGVTWEKDGEGNWVPKGGGKERCDLTLVGDVPLGDARALFKADGEIWFEDFSVPAGSPLCYGYWVRAYDFAGNLYDGNGGCPERKSDYLCARLRERTPPPVPVMTGLRARSNGVLVEWISSPVQDLRAFHLYRSDTELGAPQFLACVFTDGTVLHTPWAGADPACSAVPAVLDPQAARGAYLDDTAEPHRVYWYRVSALDWLGNESAGSQLDDIPASSTFTYTSDLPVTPAVLPPGVSGAGCGLDVSWTPVFDPLSLQGFVVFRATDGGPYRQVSGILPANEFTDTTARRDADHLYCVQSIDHVGVLSPPSLPVLHRY